MKVLRPAVKPLFKLVLTVYNVILYKQTLYKESFIFGLKRKTPGKK